jgi:hypothetical protein
VIQCDNGYLCSKFGNVIFSVLGMGFLIEAIAEYRKWISYLPLILGCPESFEGFCGILFHDIK